jgi:hypothetical protein
VRARFEVLVALVVGMAMLALLAAVAAGVPLDRAPEPRVPQPELVIHVTSLSPER